MNDRYRGSLLGLAVGDALGAAIESMTPGSIDLVTGVQVCIKDCSCRGNR